MAGCSKIEEHFLWPGWQAKLGLRLNNNRVEISKTFGVAARWTRNDVLAIRRCTARYREWLTLQGVPVLQSAQHTIERVNGEWRLVLVQPYLGPDCDARLANLSTITDSDERSWLMSQIMRLGLKLAFPTKPPLFRCEVKPRDFCVASDGSIVLVDTFPPVIAKRGRALVVATRRHKVACLTAREHEEVLAVTGGPVGILRNLCEHLISLAPSRKRAIVLRLIAHTERVCKETSRELALYLKTEQSADKVRVLIERRRRLGTR